MKSDSFEIANSVTAESTEPPVFQRYVLGYYGSCLAQLICPAKRVGNKGGSDPAVVANAVGNLQDSSPAISGMEGGEVVSQRLARTGSETSVEAVFGDGPSTPAQGTGRVSKPTALGFLENVEIRSHATNPRRVSEPLQHGCRMRNSSLGPGLEQTILTPLHASRTHQGNNLVTMLSQLPNRDRACREGLGGSHDARKTARSCCCRA